MKYDVKFSCGHIQTVDLFGKSEEREKKIKYFEKYCDCQECYDRQKNIENSDGCEEVEMSYREYKTNYSECKTKVGSYNGYTKTIVVYVPSETIQYLNGKLSKLLWKGTFTNGSITVPNFSKYRYFLVNVNGVICYGNRNYGIGGYLEYGSYAVRFYGYRFSVKENSDIVSITDLEKGGSNGQENVPITEIYGVFQIIYSAS